MTATERFKALFANYVERVCVLEEQLEQATLRIAELEAPSAPSDDPQPDR